MNLRFWKKTKEPTPFPQRFALIRFTKHAKESGIFDDENKIIEIYKDGELAEPPQPYSKELVSALIEIDEIPVVEEKFEEEPFDFEESADFGSTEYRR